MSDDSATNGLKFWDDHGKMYQPGNGNVGDWMPSKSCPPGSAIIGFQTQVQDWKGWMDNTALNRVKFTCEVCMDCHFDDKQISVSEYNIEENVDM